MFDNVCRFLAESFSADFATWLIGEPVALTELSPSELSLEPIRADALILLQSDDLVLHIEFQTEPKAVIPFRMTDYRLRVYRRFPRKRMVQYVIYLQPTTSELVHETAFILENTRQYNSQFAVRSSRFQLRNIANYVALASRFAGITNCELFCTLINQLSN
jgi:predicted transposase/invertase (TIGR01784 family)